MWNNIVNFLYVGYTISILFQTIENLRNRTNVELVHTEESVSYTNNNAILLL